MFFDVCFDVFVCLVCVCVFVDVFFVFMFTFQSSQSLMISMQTGDSFSVLLHEGALRGSDGEHPFITLIGYKISDNKN